MNNRPKVRKIDWRAERRLLRLDLIIATLFVMLHMTILTGISTYILVETVEQSNQTNEIVATRPDEEAPPQTAEKLEETIDQPDEKAEPAVPAEPKLSVSEAEIELLALVTMAEAEGESEEGKRLVIDTILNRVDSDRWPDTITEVIYQPNQFTSMWNGRVDRCHVTDEVRQLVVEELISRTNSEVVFFTAGGYGRYGTPAFQVGNHYFCT